MNDSLDLTRIQYTRFNGKGTRLLCGSEYQLKPCAITIFDLPEKKLSSADVGQVRLTSKDWHNPQFPVYDRPTARIQDCCFAGKDDELVVAATGDENVYIWSVPDGKGKRVIDQELLDLFATAPRNVFWLRAMSKGRSICGHHSNCQIHSTMMNQKP